MLTVVIILLCLLCVTNTTALIIIIGLRTQIRRDMDDVYWLIKQKVNAFLEVFRKAKNHENHAEPDR